MMEAESKRSSHKSKRLFTVIEDVVRRRSAGEDVPDETVIREHPDLLPELTAKLIALQEIDDAERRAKREHGLPGSSVSRHVDSNLLQMGLPSDSIPGYAILGEIHRGAQGVVYRATQLATHREVAIKVMREGPISRPLDEARFEREVRILARLKHPNIVTIHDSGAIGGTHYFVMDCVDGVPLDLHFPEDEAITQKIELFAKICEAVTAAHLKGIIHRDLKPSNILVDSNGQPHVLDFGLAKALTEADEATRARDMTITGQFVGSLPWASPEQADGAPDLVDLRSDVYSLGVMLYQLLTGRFPYTVIGKMRDVLGHILETEPIKPRAIRRDIDEELETIVLKCLAKDPERRYQMAGELARDLRHYLADEAIDAKRDSTLYVLRKQIRRHRAPLVVAAGFVVLLIVSSIVAWTLYLRSQESLRKAYLAEAHATRLSGKAGQRFDTLDALFKAAAIRPSIELRDEAIAAMALTDVRIIREVATGLGDQVAVACATSNSELHYWSCEIATGKTAVRSVATNETVLTLPDRPYGSYPRFSRDGRYIACRTELGCEVWDLATSTMMKRIPSEAAHLGQPFDFNPNGHELAIGTEDGKIHVIDLTSSDARILPPVHVPVHHIRFDSSGNRLATSSTRSGDVLIRDTMTGEVLHTLTHPERVWRIAWSPDGTQLACGCDDSNVHVWDTRTGIRQFILRGHTSPVDNVGFDSTGGLLFSAGWDGATRLWNPRSGAHLLDLLATNGNSFTSSDRLAFTTGRNGQSLGVAQIVSGSALRSLVGRRVAEGLDRGRGVCISGDGRVLASACYAGVRIWDFVHGRQVALLPTGSSASAVFHPDDTALFTISDSGVLRWPIDAGPEVIRFGPPELLLDQPGHELFQSCISAEGRTLVVASRKLGHALVFDLQQTGKFRKIGPHRAMRYVALSPNGKWLATGAWGGGGVKIWNLAGGELVHELAADRSTSVGFSPDGKWLVTSGPEHVIWSTSTWRPVARFSRAEYTGGPGAAIAFTRDSSLVAIKHDSSPVQLSLISLAGLKNIATLEMSGNSSGPESLAFTPDGTQLIFPRPQEGHIVYIWDLRSIREQLAEMNLDWDLPPYPPPAPPESIKAFRVKVDLGELAS